MTPFLALRDLCGMTTEETADYLAVSVDLVKSWLAGRRNTPEKYLVSLHDLGQRIEATAQVTLRAIDQAIEANEAVTDISLSVASGNRAAQKISGLPNAGAHAAMLRRLILSLPADMATAVQFHKDGVIFDLV